MHFAFLEYHFTLHRFLLLFLLSGSDPTQLHELNYWSGNQLGSEPRDQISISTPSFEESRSRRATHEIRLSRYTSYCQYQRILRFDQNQSQVTLTAIGYKSIHMVRVEDNHRCRNINGVQGPHGLVILLPGLGLPSSSMIHYANALADNGFVPILMESPCLRTEPDGGYLPDFRGALCLSRAINTFDVGIPLILIGYSYGGSIAIVASALNTKVSAVAAIAPVVSWESLKHLTGQGAIAQEGMAFPKSDCVLLSRLKNKFFNLDGNSTCYPKDISPNSLASEISVPVLIVGGEKDSVSSRSALELLNESLQISSLLVLDAGHPQLLSSKEFSIPSLIIQWLDAVLK